MKIKTLSRQEAIEELTDKHGLDYLNARNMVVGKTEVSRAELDQISEKIGKSKSAARKRLKMRTFKPKSVSLRPRSKGVFRYNDTRGEIRSFINNIDR